MGADHLVPFVSAVLHHLAQKPTSAMVADAESASSVLNWLADAPAPFFGNVVGSAVSSPDDFAAILQRLSPSHYDMVASLANSMAVPDSEWDRDIRDSNAVEIATHSSLATRHPAQTSAEFAALDLLTDAGYASIDDAVGALADLRRATPGTVFTTHVAQFSRSRHSVSGRIHLNGEWHYFLTPWCLSRKVALAYVAILFHQYRRVAVEARVARRAATATSYATRRSLDDVRALVDPAVALLTTYAYSPTSLAFVDSDGRNVQTIQTRMPYVWVAFAAVHTKGASDVLLEISQRRVDAAGIAPVFDDDGRISEYNENVVEPMSGFLMFSRVLAYMRQSRASTHNPFVNKGPMLTYIARGRSNLERNTCACINRMEEVVALARKNQREPSSYMMVVEWGGEINQSAILASAAASGIDLALDVSGSGLDLPGMDVVNDGTVRAFNYQLYLTSAERRTLPRMPSVEYPEGTPLHAKLGILYDQLSAAGGALPFVYVSGGVAGTSRTPVSVCSDSAALLSGAQQFSEQSSVLFATAEFLLPPLCNHGLHSPVDVYLSSFSQVADDCAMCDSHYRALSILMGPIVDFSARAVKTRSMYAHNAHFSLEISSWNVDPAGDTLTTIDSAMASNIVRNAPWPAPATKLNPEADPLSQDVVKLVEPIVRTAYDKLAERYSGLMSREEADAVAASIT